jgi:PiT family inorganic phosphate transporter
VAFPIAIAMALAFAVTIGLHAGNSIASLVATRTARPGPAIAMAGACNLLAPFVIGVAVADTVAGLVRVAGADAVPVVGAGLTSAVAWGIFSWSRGLPASSSHALVGGLVGAALAAAGTDAVDWGSVAWVLAALALAPLAGFVAAGCAAALLRRGLRRATTRIDRPVRGLQWATSACLAFGRGANDTHKAVGVIVALLLARGRVPTPHPPAWAILAASLALTAGTATGGWRIVRTIGRGIFRLRPLDGLASQVGSAAVILAASLAGLPVSATQTVSSSVVGTGVGRGRRRHVRWEVVIGIATSWITTLPVTGVLAALTLPVWRWLA